MPRKKSPNSVSNYFNDEVESAILKYNISTSQDEKDRLFRIIYPALAKIAEVMYHKVKPSFVQLEPLEFQMDCIAFMTERLHFIKEGKGKAFSYMTVTGRNFYIQHNMKAYNALNKVVSYDYFNDKHDITDTSDIRKEEMEESAALLNGFCNYLEENKNNITNGLARKGLPVVNEVINLIRNIDDIEDFNRRNLMNSLTEINGLKLDRHYITKVFNRLEIHYLKFKEHWLKSKTQLPYVFKTSLSKEEIEYCIENYRPSNKLSGIISFAKKFGVEEYVIRKELNKAGLCSI
jgi:hypothetical protein